MKRRRFVYRPVISVVLGCPKAREAGKKAVKLANCTTCEHFAGRTDTGSWVLCKLRAVRDRRVMKLEEAWG